MFRDIQKGFNFSLGRLLSRVFFFIVIGFIVLLIGSCKAHADDYVGYTGIYTLTNSNSRENYNVGNIPNSGFWTPTNTGGYQALFNNGGNTSNNNNYYRFNINTVNYSFSLPSNANSYNIDFYLYYQNYTYPNLDNRGTWNPSDTSTYAGGYSSYTPVYYCTCGNNQVFMTLDNPVGDINNGISFHLSGLVPQGSNNCVFTIPVIVNRGSNLHPLDNFIGMQYGVSGVRYIIASQNTETIINNQTTQIINNNNTNTGNILQRITNIPSAVASALEGLFGSLNTHIYNVYVAFRDYILDAIDDLWTNISGAFTTLFGWLSDIFDSIQDILSDDEPTSQYLEEFVDEFIGSNDNIILEFITLPIQFITAILNSNTCSSISLGTLYGSELVLPCLGSKIASILGTSIYTFISTILTALIYWRLCGFLYDVIEKVMTLSLDVNEKFNIDL